MKLEITVMKERLVELLNTTQSLVTKYVIEDVESHQMKVTLRYDRAYNNEIQRRLSQSKF